MADRTKTVLVFLPFIDFIFRRYIQKQLNFVVRPHLWRPLVLCLCCWALSGNAADSANSWFGVCLTSPNSLRVRSDIDRIIFECPRCVLGCEPPKKKSFQKYPRLCGQGRDQRALKWEYWSVHNKPVVLSSWLPVAAQVYVTQLELL